VEELKKCRLCGNPAQLCLVRDNCGAIIYMEVCADCIQPYDLSAEDDLTKLFELSAASVGTFVENCSCCGITWREVLSLGRMGCSRCLEELSLLQPMMERHCKSSYCADQFSQKAATQSCDYIFNLAISKGTSWDCDMLSLLKSQLKRAVFSEQFEAAAILRDRIRRLEQKNP
jgi:protein-arginine kinase activator protein McsA